MRTFLRGKVTLLLFVGAALLAFAGTAMALTTGTDGDTSGTTSPSPTIQSDKDGYAPGERSGPPRCADITISTTRARRV